MHLKRWQKTILAVAIWIAFAVLVSIPIASISPDLAIFTQFIGTVVSLLSPRISDKILDAIFGKEKPEEKPAKLAREFAEEKQKREERERRIRELEGLIHEDSGELIDALRLWFTPPSSLISINPFGSVLQYSLSLASVAYWIDGNLEPRINYLGEPSWTDPRIADRVKEHLADSDWKSWAEAKEAVNAHLEKVKALWEAMQQTIRSDLLRNCPSMTEWYHRGNPPTEYYNMDYCLEYVWQEIERAVEFNVSPSFEYLHEDPNELGRIGMATTYARSPNPDTRRAFVSTISNIGTRFLSEFRGIYAERNNIEEMIDRFRKAIDGRIYDFEHPPHYNLPSKCVRCKPLHEELEKLKQSSG